MSGSPASPSATGSRARAPARDAPGWRARATNRHGRVQLKRVRVLIRPKAGILDPQGQAVERALPALGFSGVANVHVGRLVELDVEDTSAVHSMCERLLTNPLIEDYEIVDV